MRTLIVTLLAACSLTASRQLFSQARAQAIAAAFTKHKSVAKESHGVRREKYKDVRSEPVVKQNISDYSGVYEVAELSYVLRIQVGADGRVHANGHDGGEGSRSFELQDARIEGALLTGTKVYPDASTERFEGVFMMRTERNSPTDTGHTTFGLGVLLRSPIERGGMTYDKLFYQLKQ